MKFVSYRACGMLAIGMGLLFYKYALQLFPGVMTSHLMSQWHLSGTGLGNLAACFFYGYVVMQWFAGQMVDTAGVTKPAMLALMLSVLGVLMFREAQGMQWALFARLLMGAGSAFATVIYLRTARLWFQPAHRGFTGGLLTLGVMGGAFLATLPLSFMIRHRGVQAAFELLTEVGVLLFIITACWLCEPGDVRRLPLRGTGKALLQLVCCKNNQLIAVYSGLAFAPLAVFGGLWGTPFLSAVYHLSTAHSAGLVSLSYVGFGVGGPLFGYMSDRRAKRVQFMLVGLLVSFCFLWVIIFFPVRSLWVVGLCLLGFGLGTGSFMLGFTMAKELNPAALSGSVVSFINSGDALLGALTEPFIGHLLDWGWRGKMQHGARVFGVADYQQAFAFLLIYLLLAAVMVGLLSRRAGSPHLEVMK